MQGLGCDGDGPAESEWASPQIWSEDQITMVARTKKIAKKMIETKRL